MRQIINNVRIFDGSGDPLRPGAVAIEGERIAEVSWAGEIPAQAGDLVLDGGGSTLMPGLVEAHAHLSWGSSVERIYPEFMLPPDELKVATWRNARVLLDHGFTSAYSAGALGESIEVELKADIEAGRTPGPRLRTSTIERSPEGAEGVQTGDVDHGRGPQAMTQFVEHCARLGVDTVKLLISGEDALKPGSSQHILYTDAELGAAAEAASRHGLWLAAHTQAAEAIKLGLRNGVRTLYHCTYADPEALDMLESKRDEIFVAPAIGIIVATLEATPPPHIDMSGMKESAKPVIELASKLIPELKRRGVRVLPGGDYGFPFNPNGRNARDLEHFVTLFGYTPAEALVAATRLGGQIMGLEHDIGLVKTGYLADLLLVDGDPSADVRVLQDKARLKMIMKGGAMHKAPEPAAAHAA